MRMSFVEVISIGLGAHVEGFPVSKYLLLSKFKLSKFLSLSMFVPGMSLSKDTKIFPQIRSLDILELTNKVKGMAMACAADDLGLSFNGENGQVEIFDNFVPSESHNYQHDQQGFGNGKIAFPGMNFPSFDKHFNADLGLAHLSRFGINEHSPDSLSSSQSHTMRHPFDNHPSNGPGSGMSVLPLNNFYSDQEMNFAGSHHSHFDIMSSGVQLDTQFTDFKRGSLSTGSTYSSSIDSFDSPLDDMFLPRQDSVFSNSSLLTLHNRKRKQDSSPDANFVVSSQNTTPEIKSFAYEGQKKMKLESLDRFSSDSSQVIEKPALQPELFLHTLGFSQTPSISAHDQVSKHDEDDKEKARYMCPDCDAAFKVKSYLTRHLRKHNNAKAFVCPFYREQDSDYCGNTKAGTKCHPTGGFSRKDTYKTHLKALHFIYPPRTKSSERGTQGGRCAGCFQFFESNADWFKYHIEDGSCKGFVNTNHVKVKQESQA